MYKKTTLCYLFLLVFGGLEYMEKVDALTSIALNKPSYQSGGFDLASGRANDGDPSTNCCSSQCATVPAGPAPYWGTDLEGIYKLDSVRFITRVGTFCIGICAERLGNFEVRMGFNSANPGENNLCTYHTSVIRPDNNVSVTCDVSKACGRYLTVQRTGPPNGEPLDICELYAYAEVTPITSRQMTTKSLEKDKQLLSHVLMTRTVTSTVECIRFCLERQYECRSVNIYDVGGFLSCDINGVATEDDPSYVLTNVTGSKYYSIHTSSCQ